LHDELIYVLETQSLKLLIEAIDLMGGLVETHNYTQIKLLTSSTSLLFTGHAYFALFSSLDGPQIAEIGSKTDRVHSISTIVKSYFNS
jgi:hypothetical protein